MSQSLTSQGGAAMFWLGELSSPERDLREFHSGVFVKFDSAPRANILEKTGGLL